MRFLTAIIFIQNKGGLMQKLGSMKCIVMVRHTLCFLTLSNYPVQILHFNYFTTWRIHQSFHRHYGNFPSFFILLVLQISWIQLKILHVLLYDIRIYTILYRYLKYIFDLSFWILPFLFETKRYFTINYSIQTSPIGHFY